jgi:uridine kinase
LDLNNIRTLPLIGQRIEQLKRERKKVLIAIDGRGASGKTTLASQLENLLLQAEKPTVQLIHMDDFLKPQIIRQGPKRIKNESAAYCDRQRLIAEVLNPWRKGEASLYAQYNWFEDSLSAQSSLNPSDILIVEGVFSLHSELRAFYDLSIWLECDADACLKQALSRDGEEASRFWKELWIPEETHYLEVERPDQFADFVLSVPPRTMPPPPKQ